MRVITLSDGAVEWQGRELAKKITDACPEGFDLMVGVRRGGVFVADAVWRSLPDGFCVNIVNVTMQRPGTRGKGAKLAAVLGNVPLWMLNGARIVESHWLKLRDRMKRDKERHSRRQMTISTGTLPPLKAYPRLLLIDDAIDSGATLAAVIKGLRENYGPIEVKVAVITVTTDAPKVEADFCMYHDHTLIRFPWSIDYKKMKP